MDIIALGSLIKTVFVLGESAPIWGRYGHLKFCNFGVFWDFNGDFLENWSSDFYEIFKADRTTAEV